ncbi:MAG TPA: HNH endonuclease domain-containing protein [Gammaproteobacteria bacterium]|nr:HNH endonuclease domain-containing protein [Gammaproteobacteria bacterium]
MSESDSADDNHVRDNGAVYVVRRDTLREFNAILQRDATDTTYKYALLRALIEIAEQQSHHVTPGNPDAAPDSHSLHSNEDWVSFPLGLIVEKWLTYYYPFVERRLPQRHGERPRSGAGQTLAFRRSFEPVTDFYRSRGGLSALSRDLEQRGIPQTIDATFRRLLGDLRRTITRYPMKHLGFSRYKAHYQVADYNRARARRLRAGPITRQSLIACLGTARLRRNYYETFRAVGGFATGADAIFAQWARFTAAASPAEPVTIAAAAEALLASAEDERNVQAAASVYHRLLQQRGALRCVWSDRRIGNSRTLAVDHAIPFSIWGSNALWNLLPAARTINANKSDRIPDPELIHARRDTIVDYWHTLEEAYSRSFQPEYRLSLAGMCIDFTASDWTDAGIRSLSEKCEYLIRERGFPAWRP